MRIANITIHNFGSIADASLDLANCSLLIGTINPGQTNVIDAPRGFYVNGSSYEAGPDFPRFLTAVVCTQHIARWGRRALQASEGRPNARGFRRSDRATA